jgi:hypothetical protein
MATWQHLCFSGRSKKGRIVILFSSYLRLFVSWEQQALLQQIGQNRRKIAIRAGTFKITTNAGVNTDTPSYDRKQCLCCEQFIPRRAAVCQHCRAPVTASGAQQLANASEAGTNTRAPQVRNDTQSNKDAGLALAATLQRHDDRDQWEVDEILERKVQHDGVDRFKVRCALDVASSALPPLKPCHCAQPQYILSNANSLTGLSRASLSHSLFTHFCFIVPDLSVSPNHCFCTLSNCLLTCICCNMSSMGRRWVQLGKFDVQWSSVGNFKKDGKWTCPLKIQEYELKLKHAC